MRLLCIDNSGCPELEIGAYYTGEWACNCKTAFKLHELPKPQPRSLSWTGTMWCVEGKCRVPLNEFTRRRSYKKERFVCLDDLHEIEQAEYSEQLQNV